MIRMRSLATVLLAVLALGHLSFAQTSSQYSEGSEASYYSGGLTPGLGASTHEPVLATQLNAMRQEVERSTGGFRAPRSLNPTTADYEFQTFTLSMPTSYGSERELSGTSHSVRLAFAKGSPNGRLAYGLRGAFNYASLEWSSRTEWYDSALDSTYVYETSADSSTVNFTTGLFLDYQLWQQGRLRLRGGVSADYLHYGANEVDGLDNGYLAALNTVLETTWDNGAMANAGMRLQYSAAGDYTNTTLGLALLYNRPMLTRLDLQASVLGDYILTAAYPSLSMLKEPINDFTLVAGIGATYYLTAAIGINLQYRTPFLIDDYSSHSLQLGSRMAF